MPLPIEEIPNENFAEELRQKYEQNHDEDRQYQRIPDETIYYYVERIIADTSRETMLGVRPDVKITVYTHFSLNEDELKEHRRRVINQNTSYSIPYTDDNVAFANPINNIRFEISAIQQTSSVLPRYQRQANRRVTSIQGIIF